MSKGALCKISTMTLPCIWAMLRHVFRTNLHEFTWSPLPTQNPCTRKTYVVFRLYLRPWHTSNYKFQFWATLKMSNFLNLSDKSCWGTWVRGGCARFLVIWLTRCDINKRNNTPKLFKKIKSRHWRQAQ